MKIRGMERYEGGWPIDAYVHMFVKQHRRNQRHYKPRIGDRRPGNSNSTAQKSSASSSPTQRAYVLVPKARVQKKAENIVRTKQELEDGRIVDISENEGDQSQGPAPEEELEEDGDIPVNEDDQPNEFEHEAAMLPPEVGRTIP